MPEPQARVIDRCVAPAVADVVPPLIRGSMPPRPWLGFWRSLRAAAFGLRFDALAGQNGPPWHRAARSRRRVLMAAVMTLAVIGYALAGGFEEASSDLSGLAALAQGAKTALFVLLFSWIGVGFITALMGAWSLLRGDPHALVLPPAGHPIAADARTALVMPICNEDVATVFGGLRATCESLAATGALRLFDVFVLSDTADPQARQAEAAAFEQLRASLGLAAPGAGGGLHIRWRRRRTHRKAGNVADFCRRWGRAYRYMIVLDADSTMQGETLVAMVRAMEAQPRVGILQTLPQAVGHGSLHARAQQFASRVTGRLFALGMAWWQLGESHYWGHNAILRLEPFMRHCALAPLPGDGSLSGSILSHDFVEAALMRRAGYEVWLAPSLAGSWEQHPAHLLDELQRDRRWCQGNLQNARLIAEPGWASAHRFMFLTGALSYAVAPLWIGFVGLGLWAASTSAAAPAPMPWSLWALTLVMLTLPRVLGVAAVFLAGEARLFGGPGRLVGGALLEALLSAALAPLRMLAHALFVTGALTGWRLNWKSPPREAQVLPWGEALRRIGWPALGALGMALALLWASQREGAALSSGMGMGPVPPAGSDETSSPSLADRLGGLIPFAPIALPWLLAAPLAVWGSRTWLRGWLRVPEERAPPRTLRRASSHADFRSLLPSPAAPSLPAAIALAVPQAPTAAVRRGPGFRQEWAGVALTVAMLAAVALPRSAHSPELDAERREALSLQATSLRESTRIAAVRTSRPADAGPALRLLASSRPARFIDEATRERAMEFVRQQAMTEVGGG